MPSNHSDMANSTTTSEMQNWAPINYDLSNIPRVMSETTERYGKIKKLAGRIIPLIESNKKIFPAS